MTFLLIGFVIHLFRLWPHISGDEKALVYSMVKVQYSIGCSRWGKLDREIKELEINNW
jgi:hypothetical protein